MPKPIPRRAKRPIVSLHFRYRRYLWSGKPGALHFLEREHVENLWAEYGQAITERYARKWPGSRPPPYWRYQPLPERWDSSKESQYAFLHRHHLLLPGENARARQQRRSSTKPVAAVPLPLPSLRTETPPAGWGTLAPADRDDHSKVEAALSRFLSLCILDHGNALSSDREIYDSLRIGLRVSALRKVSDGPPKRFRK